MCYTFVYLRGCTRCVLCVPILRRNSPFAVFLLASVSIKMFALDEKDPRRASRIGTAAAHASPLRPGVHGRYVHLHATRYERCDSTAFPYRVFEQNRTETEHLRLISTVISLESIPRSTKPVCFTGLRRPDRTSISAAASVLLLCDRVPIFARSPTQVEKETPVPSDISSGVKRVH